MNPESGSENIIMLQFFHITQPCEDPLVIMNPESGSEDIIMLQFFHITQPCEHPLVSVIGSGQNNFQVR